MYWQCFASQDCVLGSVLVKQGLHVTRVSVFIARGLIKHWVHQHVPTHSL